MIWALLAAAAGAVELEHRLIETTTDDGQVLVGRLSRPLGVEGPLPVVVHAHGSGPWTWERPVRFEDGEVVDYASRYAELAAERGMAFFLQSKRGCERTESPPYFEASREVFGKATIELLSSDLVAGIRTLREQPDIDPERMVLVGVSEGTETGPRAIRETPEGFLGAALVGYVEQEPVEVVRWQRSEGPFRGVLRMADRNRDQRVTREEWFAHDSPHAELAWSVWDRNGDGVFEAWEMERLQRKRLRAFEKALARGDDDWFWENLLNLNLGMWLPQVGDPPNHTVLLDLDMPVAIFHGEYDGAVPVEGALNATMALREAEHDVQLHVVPGGDHGLVRLGEAFDETRQLPDGWRQVFDQLATWVDVPFPPDTAEVVDP